MSDGPNGVRGLIRDERSTALCTPCGTALGASWDEKLVQRVGRLIAAEAKRQAVDVVLGPTINIQRSPLGGRGFESFSEDPWLAGQLAAAWIEGVQSGGVAACPKHFVANDSETSRTSVDCIVDERALREIYLVPFEHALKAGAWAMMAAYNRINGSYACENRSLLTDLVRIEWGWDGLIVSDWCAPRDTVACANAGLDLEMPGPGRCFGEPLARAVGAGLVPPAMVDEAVNRLQRLAQRVRRRKASAAVDLDVSSLLAHAAADGMVLLKNDHDVLPVTPRQDPWTLALIGPHAVNPCIQGGGSAAVGLTGDVRTLDKALRERFGPGVDVVLEPGCLDALAFPPLERLDVVTGPGSATEGTTVRYFDHSGRLGHQENRRSSNLVWDNGIPGVDQEGGRVEVTALLVPHVSGTYVFSVQGSGATSLRVDGLTVAALPDQTRPDDPLAPFFSDLWAEGPLMLVQGVPVKITVRMEHGMVDDTLPVLRFGCRPPTPPDLLHRALSAARNADVVIVVVGTGQESEAESTDRTSTRLSAEQDSLVRSVLEVHPDAVVVVNAGTAVHLPWADEAAAVLLSWFPGQEYAQALSGVLCGAFEPGGRLPITLAAEDDQYPAWSTNPDARGQLIYSESVFVGYRHFDAAGHVPRFPFGHGLGYTRFEFCDMSVQGPDQDGAINVDVELRNAGTRDGKEVVQLYVAPPHGRVPRPPCELKAFAAVRLQAGSATRVTFRLDQRAFSYWDVTTQRWTHDAGQYELLVGRSSSDIRLTRTLKLQGPLVAVAEPPDTAGPEVIITP